jgi:hypothetical protein
MKRIFLFIFSISIYATFYAQNFADAWRYSQNQPVGTARYTSMSGAFSSLGGDLSAIGLNPAGATTFTTNRFTTTLQFFNSSSEAGYFNNNKLSDYNSFDDNILNFSQLGVIWAYQSDVNNWNKIALAVNYNKDANYGDYYRIAGTNEAGNSLTQYFAGQANGIPLKDLETVDGIDDDYQWLGENYGFDAQQAYLGYQAYVINPVDDTDVDNVNYTENALYNKVNHLNKIYTTGHKSSVDFALAGTYQNKLQLGLGIAAYSIDFVENNSIVENGYDANSDLQLLKMKNTLRVEGSGVAIKLGAIYKLTKGVKMSLAYHSPEWLEINEYLKQSVYTEMKNGEIHEIAPDIENTFAPYRVITPSKWIAGASFVINKKGLLSVDYTYQNMSKLHFKEIDYDADTTYFDTVNDEISDTMQAVHKLNLGGEVKLDDLSLRAGGFLTTSPVKADKDAYTTTGFSFGVGYNFGGFVVDATYLRSDIQTKQYLLNIPNAAKINETNNKFFIGARFNF